MILKGNEDLTDVSILEAMRLFEKERKEDILLDITINPILKELLSLNVIERIIFLDETKKGFIKEVYYFFYFVLFSGIICFLW